MLTNLDKIYSLHGVVAIVAIIVNLCIGDMEHHLYIAMFCFISALAYRVGKSWEVKDV